MPSIWFDLECTWTTFYLALLVVTRMPFLPYSRLNRARINLVYELFFALSPLSCAVSMHTTGAYIFRPTVPTADLNWVNGASEVAVEVIEGPLVVEVRQSFALWLNQTVRLVKGASHVSGLWHHCFQSLYSIF